MRTKLIVLFVAIFVFFVGFFSYQWFFPDTFFSKMWKNNGELSVDSKPGASVFVDNTLVGQTPLQISLSEDVHMVKLVPEVSKETSLQTWSEKIKIYKNTTTYIKRNLGKTSEESSGDVIIVEKSNAQKGQMLINTRPTGLFVSLNGEQRGLSPLLLDNLEESEYEITIKGEGLLPRTLVLKTKNGYKLLVDVSLGIDGAFKEKKQLEQKKAQEDQKNASVSQVRILDTPTGWLRVRFEPSLDASEAAKLNAGTIVPSVSKKDNWYEVVYEEGKRGWIAGEYVEEIKPTPASDAVTPGSTIT